MQKEIAIDQLVVDMYVSGLITQEGGALPKKKRGMVRDQRIIDKFIEIGIVKVIIDTDKGLDTSSNDDYISDPSSLNLSIIEKELQSNLASVMLQTSTEYRDLKLEWGTAKEVFDTSVSIVTHTMEVAKEGREINPEYFREAANAISRSVLRNKDALTWLGRFRNVNNYLYEHSVNSAVLMGIFAHAYGLPQNEVAQCINGALLHDLGEAKINPEFFNREGPLSDEEYIQVQGHVGFGLALLDNDLHASVITKAIIREHHERMNGSGYPLKLKGDEISLYGRMFAIVDTYDAVTNKRTYREAEPSSVGMKTLLEQAGDYFDEGLVHAFIKCMGVYPTGSLVKLDNDLLAVVIGQTPKKPLQPLVRTIFSVRSMAYIEPKMIKLASDSCDMKIKSYEDPADYGITVNDFMPEELMI